MPVARAILDAGPFARALRSAHGLGLALLLGLGLGAPVAAQAPADEPLPTDDAELVEQLKLSREAALRLRAEQAANDSEAVAAARAAHEVALAELDAARTALEELVATLADDHAALTRDPAAPTRRNALVLAMVDSLPTAQARILAKEAQSGRRVARPSRTRILAEVFAEPVAKISPVDARLAVWISEKVAASLGSVSDLDTVNATRVLGHIVELFEEGEDWYAFWNRGLHADLAEGQAYAAAYARVAETGLALDQAENPERYGPRGERAPPGMIIVPGGGYDLGPNTGHDRPPRRVQLRPFALDVREVTCADYAAFVDAQPMGLRPGLLPRGWRLEGGNAQFPEGTHDHPVVFVDWNQAHAYARSLGKRLPTEDEWEAAAAGLQGWPFPWGQAFLADKANGAWTGARGTLPVESYPEAASPAGCLDMAGNVWEWTSTTDKGENVEFLPEGYVSMIIRGGGFDSQRHEISTRHRRTALGQGTFGLPTYKVPIGFRCAQDL